MSSIAKTLTDLIAALLKSFAQPKSQNLKKATQKPSLHPSGVFDVELIKESEGLRLQAYLPTPNDVWTIGYGHTKTAVKGMKITRAGAEALLLEDLRWVETAIDTYVQVPLNQNQYDALASFIYNVGATAFRKSTLLKLLNASDYTGAADQFPRWNKQKGKVLKGLTTRRYKEKTLFEK